MLQKNLRPALRSFLAARTLLAGIVCTLVASSQALSRSYAFAQSPSPATDATAETYIVEQNEFLFFPALKKDAAAALFVFAPGADRAASEYQSVLQAIQEQSGLNLAVASLKFTASFPNPIEFSGRVQSAIDYAKTQNGFENLTSSQVYLGGHSLGGIFARDIVASKNFGGLVLFASYLNADEKNKINLANVSFPVLTLGGERDGLTRITRISKEWETLQKLSQAAASPDVFAQKPVVVLPDVNHSLFASGQLQKSDFISPLKIAQAHSAIAEKVAAFLNVNAAQGTLSTTQQDVSRAVLISGVERTEALVGGFLKSVKKDDSLCEDAQLSVLNIAPDTLQTLKIKSKPEKNLVAFAGSKPRLEKGDDGALEITVSVLTNTFFNPLDITSVQESNKEIACKMKSQEAVLAEVSGSITGDEKSCAELNTQTLEWALSQVTEPQRARYLNEGQPLIAAADKVAKTGITWLPVGLDVKKDPQNPGQSLVTSATLRTDLNAPQRYAGMAYCKLLPASRAVEWILIESFR